MKLKQHITISLFFSALLLAITKSWIIFSSSLISGVLIDLDHVLDYFREYGVNSRIKQFFKVFYNAEISSVWLIFHSWELLFLMSISVFIMKWNPWIVGITIGFTQHIVLDHIFNKSNQWTYSFFWRFNNNFCTKKICSN